MTLWLIKGVNRVTINDKIDLLRYKLNKSIENNEKKDTIYSLSIELDKLIALYYINKNKVTYKLDELCL